MDPTMGADLLRCYGEDASLETRVAFLVDKVTALEQAWTWKRALLDEALRSEHTVADLQSSSAMGTMEHPLLYSLADKLGIVSAVKRAVVEIHCEAKQQVAAAARRHHAHEAKSATRSKERQAPTTIADSKERAEMMEAVTAARDGWEAITRDEMFKLAAELKKPLRAVRQAEAPTQRIAEQLMEADVLELSDFSLLESEGMQQQPKRQKLSVNRFLYDGNDLLHALQAIKTPSRSPDTTVSPSWGSMQLRLFPAPSPADWRRTFAELSPEVGQIGLDDLFLSERPQFVAEKTRVGELVLTHHSITMARQYAKTGCPTHLRAQMWSQTLAVCVSAKDRSYFQSLQDLADRWSYLTDDMYLLDLQRTIDSSDYFVFEDILKPTILAFTRDAHVKDAAPRVNGAVQESSNPTVSVDSEPALANDSIPQNGVLPFSGLIMYLAPLTYVTTDMVELYFLFREMYVRYWSELNCISTDSGTILHLCQLFEDLVGRSTPTAVFHLVNIGISPLDVAFPWIQGAFSGVLQIDQVLLLWDRVIGFDSVEIIAYMAAALFHFRADELVCVMTRDALDDLFAELMEVQVIPVLQGYLFFVNNMSQSVQ